MGAAPAYAVPEAAQRQQIAGAYSISPGTARLPRAVPAADAATAVFQDRLDSALQRMLDTVLGPGRSAVATNVELDLDMVARSSVSYTRDPSAAALSEQISERSYTADNGGTRYESNSASRVHALDVLHETRREAPGDIIRLSVAVLVDDAAAANTDLAQVRELVASAAGIDAGRGDRVTVAAMPMRAGATTPADSAVAQSGTGSPAGLPTVLICAALILLTCAVLALRRRRRRTTAASVTDQRELLRQLHDQRTPVFAVAEPITASTGHARKQHHAIGPIDPAQAAQQLRDWIGPGR
ncbi:MAG TPA: flagellar M-ring protein FliF C-terminal domain-containing protein [Actinoplanes sp.]|nr:flagellar M-ring protein FliF C-terminal domain-containing protein [Actinoplanes sp.]